jgi:predicted transcriptional regulator
MARTSTPKDSVPIGNTASENGEDLYVMTHPLRRKIVQLLARNDSLYIAKIATGLNMSEKVKLVAFHLAVLGEHGLVKGKYDIRHGPETDPEGRPIIVNYYSLTDKARKLMADHKL